MAGRCSCSDAPSGRLPTATTAARDAPRPGDLRSPDLPRLLRRHHRPRPLAAIVAAVPGGQLAVRTGAVSGLLVVDVDPAHGGDDSLSDLMARQLVPRTLHVRTGSGGLHLYYRHPGRTSPSRPMPNRAGIDIKADGGYVVLPPSIHHRTHRPYRWGDGRRPRGDAPRPGRRVPAQPRRPIRPAPANRPSHDHPGGGHLPPRQAPQTPTWTPYATHPKGKRRTTLYGAARGVARMVAAGAIDHADAVAVLTDAGHQAEQTDRDIRAAIAGGFRDEGIAAA